MAKTVRIKESDLTNIVKRIVNENKRPTQKPPTFKRNIQEGYKKFGCKFLQSRKSLNEDKLNAATKTKKSLNERSILNHKIKFLDSMIKENKCGVVITEQKETTTPTSRNKLRRMRKKIYENMDWKAVLKNNTKRILENRQRKGKTL